VPTVPIDLPFSTTLKGKSHGNFGAADRLKALTERLINFQIRHLEYLKSPEGISG
jgi:hypothetical protein